MIRLIRDDGMEILLNDDRIRSVDTVGERTVILLSGGEVLTVKNSAVDVVTKMRAARQGLEEERRAYDEALKGGDVRKKTSPSRPAEPPPQPDTEAPSPPLDDEPVPSQENS